MKFSKRTICKLPAAAAMTAALIFGAQAQAQTPTPPATASGDKAAIPSGPNTGAKTPEQRDAQLPAMKSISAQHSALSACSKPAIAVK